MHDTTKSYRYEQDIRLGAWGVPGIRPLEHVTSGCWILCNAEGLISLNRSDAFPFHRKYLLAEPMGSCPVAYINLKLEPEQERELPKLQKNPCHASLGFRTLNASAVQFTDSVEPIIQQSCHKAS
jgi:hypothetical protein